MEVRRVLFRSALPCSPLLALVMPDLIRHPLPVRISWTPDQVRSDEENSRFLTRRLHDLRPLRLVDHLDSQLRRLLKLRPRAWPRDAEVGLRTHASHGLGPELFGLRSAEHTSELQSLMSISYAVFCLKQQTSQNS